MPDTVTTHYELVLPEVGASKDTWGNKTNSNMNEIDTQLWNLRNYVQNADPIGMVKMWAGLIADIPANHSLCDGAIVDGVQTPDLRERFIIGGKMGGDFEPGDFGGALDHNHGGSVSALSLTVQQMPVHRHGLASADGGNGFVSGLSLNGVQNPAGGGNFGIYNATLFTVFPQSGMSLGGYTGGNVLDGANTPIATGAQGQPHTHTITTVSNLSPFYVLAFIMRTSYPWT